MHPYLYISRLTLSFISEVGQGGKCHILNQLLELLIACHKVCLTVHLHQKQTNKQTNRETKDQVVEKKKKGEELGGDG